MDRPTALSPACRSTRGRRACPRRSVARCPLLLGTHKNPKRARVSTPQVKGLQFNTFSHNLLASGAADGELCIWDMSNPAQPSLYPALRGGGSAAGSGAGEVRIRRCRAALGAYLSL